MKTFVRSQGICTRKYSTPIGLTNIDSSTNAMGKITDYTMSEEIFTVANIGKEDIIIGINWLRK